MPDKHTPIIKKMATVGTSRSCHSHTEDAPHLPSLSFSPEVEKFMRELKPRHALIAEGTPAELSAQLGADLVAQLEGLGVTALQVHRLPTFAQFERFRLSLTFSQTERRFRIGEHTVEVKSPTKSAVVAITVAADGSLSLAPSGVSLHLVKRIAKLEFSTPLSCGNAIRIDRTGTASLTLAGYPIKFQAENAQATCLRLLGCSSRQASTSNAGTSFLKAAASRK